MKYILTKKWLFISSLTILILFSSFEKFAVSLSPHFIKNTKYMEYKEIVDQAKKQRYQPIAGALRPNEIPWIFDEKYIAHGTVIEAWNADTEQNRAACSSVWVATPPYASLCKNLLDDQILAVKLTNYKNDNIAFVPVSRIALVGEGDEVVIATGVIEGNELVRSLPRLLKIIKFNRDNSTAQD